MISGGSRSTYPILLASACALLVALPFVTTFNDFLTAGAMKLGIAGPVQLIADGEARMAVSVLALVGIKAGVAGNGYLVITTAAHQSQTVFISWNCIGWQSLVLLGLSLFTGLRGNYSRMARVQVVLIGTLGTIFVNLFRVTTVSAIFPRFSSMTTAERCSSWGGSFASGPWPIAGSSAVRLSQWRTPRHENRGHSSRLFLRRRRRAPGTGRGSWAQAARP